MREEPPTPDTRFVDPFLVQDELFHAELSRVSGNSGLTDALVAAGEPVRRLRMYGFLTRDRGEATVTGHIEITELVRTGGPDAARRAMTQMALHADLLPKPGNRTGPRQLPGRRRRLPGRPTAHRTRMYAAPPHPRRAAHEHH
ncbi:FCD domain-containing protein [Streptomyces sp. NBC_00459]|uniref:FCD domain-containing protein n=1 Tax=Streptomyces sp. NBC_00459 TaxID=2975749 RepID=UPI002E19E665